MTYDELLAKIDKIKPLNSPAWDMQNALRAVVELHKPRTVQLTPDFEYTNCGHCGNELPCPTIQAIEKELN
jgi:hypothetical protein